MTYGNKYRGIYGYNYCMKILQNLSAIENHPYKDIIYKRVEIIEFYKKHGLSATVDAYEVSRATIFRFKSKLEKSKGKISSLSPKSTRPKTYRKSTILQDRFYVENVLDIRMQHKGIGKDKIKYLLDNECELERKHKISSSSIQKIINMLKDSKQLSNDTNLSFYARTEKLHEIPKKKTKRNRRGKYNPENPGDLVQIDCVIKIIDGLRRYIISAIDYNSCFSFSYAYKSLSSSSAKNFFQLLEHVAPFEIKNVQTDNGSEFLKHFDDYLKNTSVTHFFTFVRHPQQNGKIERYNRTIQEEFADYNLGSLAHDIDKFNKDMMEYLMFYNVDRPHLALKQIPPMKYIVGKIKEYSEKSQMLVTRTMC
jgi:hypothetical protein